MPELRLEADTSASPEQVLAAARDFSDKRPELWPSIEPEVYEVHETGDDFAVVTEGSKMLGQIWARERYEWSDPGVVRATVQDSNIFKPGGVWEIKATPRDGGTHVDVLNNRQMKGPRGHLLGVVMRAIGKRTLTADLRKTLNKLEESHGGGESQGGAGKTTGER
jgi:hypothetical protein